MSETHQCDICNRVFKSARSLRSHKNHHDPIYRKKSSEGYKALLTEEAQSSRNLYHYNKKYESWSKRNSHCIICDTQLVFPQEKFCSDDCRKIHLSKVNSRPKSEETKQKIRDTLNSRKKHKQKLCKFCGAVNLSNNKYYCSDECSDKAYEQKCLKISIGLKKAYREGRHLGNAYRNRKNKSFLEISFIDYINQQYPLLKYEFNYTVKIKDTNGNYIKSYFIDFYFPKQQIGIELDGSQHLQSVDYDYHRDNAIFLNHNIKILRVTYKEYFNKEKKDIIDNIIQHELQLQQKSVLVH